MTENLASPFDSIFESRELADQVLDLFRYALEEAGCTGPDDERFAVTVPRNGGKRLLRVNYGNLYFLNAWGDFEDGGPALGLPLNLDLLSQDIEYLSTGGRLSQLDSGSHDELDIRMTYVPLPHTNLESQSLKRALASAAHAYERTFGQWKRCMFYQHHRQEVIDAIFEPESRDNLFANGLAKRKPERTGKKTNQRYWRITLPDDWKTESPDGEQVRLNVWDECLRHDLAAVGFDEDKENFQVKKFMDIQIGDRVVAFLQHKMIGGIGTVTSVYDETLFEEQPADQDFWHGLLWFRIGVEWQPVELSTGNLPEKTGNMFYGQTVVELSPDDFSAVLDAAGLLSDAWDLPAISPPIRSESAFSPDTFELLSGLHRTPTSEFYQANRSAFQSLLEFPFKELLSNVAERLPAEILDVMETQRRVVAKILKNDFGQGGAWDYYWGAFYPKGSKRSQDAQLSVWMNRDYMEFGFYIGDYGSQQRERFERNCTAYLDILKEMLNPLINGECIFFGPRETFSLNADGTVTQNITYSATLEDFLADPTQFSCDVSVVIPRDELLRLNRDELAARIARTHKILFPLVLLAVSDEPLPKIEAYLNREFEEESDDIIVIPTLNKHHPLEVIAAETGFSLPLLQRWIRAIERKKQAIFYGPPGTGKTYIAIELAKHLIGGGDGFMDLVQFHPAYAYEDFIQGIRPATNDGSLSYDMVSGRFLEFCRKAEARDSLCVLIVDEINRANLARVFGELMYLLEYRDQEIPLAGGSRLRIPKNVRILGTMNTADRSIALVDHALRRRFAFLALRPDYEILRHFHRRHATDYPLDGLIGVLQDINRAIRDPHYEVGITFFLRNDLSDQIDDIWQMEIEPYLEEYFFDQPDTAARFRWTEIQKRVNP